jgi:hypothetical protein
MADYTLADTEVQQIRSYVEAMFGAPVVSIELSGNHYEYAFNNAIEEFSQFINQWAIRSNMANALGLQTDQDFTERWVSQNFEFAKSFARAYSEQLNIGGEVPIYKDYFTLSENKQVYYLPNDITINEIMWQSPPAIARYLIDPNNNPAWVQHEFGWGYMGYSFQYITPLHFTLQLANATEMRHRIYRGDFEYAIRPAPADATRSAPDTTAQTKNAVYIYPPPKEQYNQAHVWYFYKKDSDTNLYSKQGRGEFINNPGTIQYDEIPYSAFNSPAQRWVKKYTLATCKEILGRIRSKFSELPIPDATVTLDGETLVAEAQSEKDKLFEYLKEELEKVDVGNMIEGDAANAENINKQLSYNPMGIYTFGGG